MRLPVSRCRQVASAPGRIRLAVQRLPGIDVAWDDRWFERVGDSVAGVAQVGGEVEAAVLLADDETLQHLNRGYRYRDAPTDVLSFSQREGLPGFAVAPDEPAHLGDIAISVGRARAQAQAFGHSVEREIGYLLVHGLLHLLGYDHESDADQQVMRAAEEAALAAVGLARQAEMR